MVSTRLRHQKSRIHLPLLILIILFPFVVSCTTLDNRNIHLKDYELRNYQTNLKSNISGIVKSSVFFAGKYRLSEVAPELLEILKNSRDDDLCRMIVWSIYEIGDSKYCNQLQKILQNHPSEKLNDFCNFLHNFKDYEKELLLSTLK